MPDVNEVLLPGEKADDLLALFRDLVARHATRPSSPTPLEEFVVWEVTKELWRVRREGIDRDVIMQEVQNRGRAEQRRTLWVEMDARARIRSVCATNIRGLMDLGQDLAGQIESSGFEVLEGGKK